MKKVLWLMLLLVIGLNMMAQEAETAPPTTDTEVVRRVATLDWEGKIYYDVVMTFKSMSPNYLSSDYYRVKVTITDSEGKKIWKKTLKNVYLYIFSSGSVQVGKPRFNQIVVYKKTDRDYFVGVIREKEGVY
ncbi:MAG: hypothetical protein J5790_08530 [Bacteroidaceae bacterium]|nr:hypothetical protein [Bacteroidaceae bacterium]